MLQNIYELVSPYIGDLLIGLCAFFGVRVTFAPKRTKEERAAQKKENQIAKAKIRAAKLSAKLSSCIQLMQLQSNDEESDTNGNSTNE